jgi:hypothetical protein
MSDEKKLTADELKFWEACVLATLPDTVTRFSGVVGNDHAIALEVLIIADMLVDARQERQPPVANTVEGNAK